MNDCEKCYLAMHNCHDMNIACESEEYYGDHCDWFEPCIKKKSMVRTVIEIPERVYQSCKALKEHLGEEPEINDILYNAVANGTPLPAEHGWLIDANELQKKLQEKHDYLINYYGGFSQMPSGSKHECDGIMSCIGELIKAPVIVRRQKRND